MCWRMVGPLRQNRASMAHKAGVGGQRKVDALCAQCIQYFTVPRVLYEVSYIILL
jgi:hypothetical protein